MFTGDFAGTPLARTDAMACSEHKSSNTLTLTAPAKINLYLGVHATKDKQGYHRVDTVMTTLDLADVVRIAPAQELLVTTIPAADFPQQQNTAYKAAAAMGEAFGHSVAYAIKIEKHIPIRAGLGGPSTDAAAVIMGLCTLWGIDPHHERVLAVASYIGADVPFFLYGPPAYLDGRGDTMCELFKPLEGMPVALVKPQAAGVSTVAAYKRFDKDPAPLPELEPLLDAMRAHDKQAVLSHIANNLAPAACELAPEIQEVLDWLRAQNQVCVADVCGSGATVFAVCASKEAAQTISSAAHELHGWWSYAASMEKSGPTVVAG